MSTEPSIIVSVQATLHNPTAQESGPVSAAFFAYAEGWGDWYIGSAYVENIPAGGSAQVSTQWNTTGFSGTLPVSVVVNPYGRTPETNSNNNRKSATATVNAQPIADQTIIFNALPVKTLGDPPFALSATASSGLPVSFSSQTTNFCTVSGVTVTLIGVGDCVIRATQSGDAHFKPAPPVDRTFAIQEPIGGPLTQTITLPIYLLEYCLADSPVVLTGTASSGLPVSFVSETATVCTVDGNFANLVATGSCRIRAEQGGNANYLPAAPVSFGFLVNSCTSVPASQTITFTALSDRTYGDPAFIISATASSGLPVSFSSLTTDVCTTSADTVTLIAAGQCTIRASQAGNANFSPAADVDRTFTVARAGQVINFASLADKIMGDPPFALNANASSGLAVSFSSLTSGSCTVDNQVVTLVAAGDCTVRAAQAGDANYNPAPPVERTFTVQLDGNRQPQTITFGSLSDRHVSDEPFVINASSTSGLPVSFSTLAMTVCTVAGNIVALVDSGTCTIRASQAGNDQFKAAPDVDQSFAVRSTGKPTQTITFDPLAERRLGDPPFTVSAAASSGLAVAFQAGPVTVCTVAGDVVTLLGLGQCTITATQDGNDAFNPATPVVRTFNVVETRRLVLPVYLPLVGQ